MRIESGQRDTYQQEYGKLQKDNQTTEPQAECSIALAFGTAREPDMVAAGKRAIQWQKRAQIDFPALLADLRRFNPVLQ